MPELQPCAALGNTLTEVDSGFYWLIAPGVDPSTVLSQEQIDCHMTSAEVTNSSFEDGVAADGKYIWWRSSPTWVDVSSGVKDWYNAEPLTEPGIDCDPNLWNAAYEQTPYWRWRGSYAKALVTYYCIGDTPVPPPVDPPLDDGLVDCGEWSVSFVRPIQVPINTPIWIDFQITGSFPPEVISVDAITILFDSSSEIVIANGPSGILEIDIPGHQVKVILRDSVAHTLSVTVVKPDCSDTLKYDSEVLQASTVEPPVCISVYTNSSAVVCDPGTYRAVLTICETDITSNSVLVNDAGEVLPQPPVIIVHPQTQTVDLGSTVVLTVVALYATEWQWQVSNGAAWVNIPGETTPNLEFDPITMQESGIYRVVVSNSAGSVVSNEATLMIVERTTCSTYLVLRCEDDSPATCHGIHLARQGDGEADIDFVIDWISSASLCTNPVVIGADDGATDWELFMQKVGPGTDPPNYAIRWRDATGRNSGERRLLVEDINTCYRVVMTKVGPGTGESDYVLDWKSL